MASEKEIRESEDRAREWAAYSEAYLIGYMCPPTGRGAEHQNVALAEMQRRQIVAIRDFNRQSGWQANVMIGLTIAIALLTVGIAYLTWVMAQQGAGSVMAWVSIVGIALQTVGSVLIASAVLVTPGHAGALSPGLLQDEDVIGLLWSRR